MLWSELSLFLLGFLVPPVSLPGYCSQNCDWYVYILHPLHFSSKVQVFLEFFVSFFFLLRGTQERRSQFVDNHFFLFIKTKSGLLAGIRWSVFILKIQENFMDLILLSCFCFAHVIKLFARFSVELFCRSRLCSCTLSDPFCCIRLSCSLQFYFSFHCLHLLFSGSS